MDDAVLVKVLKPARQIFEHQFGFSSLSQVFIEAFPQVSQ